MIFVAYVLGGYLLILMLVSIWAYLEATGRTHTNPVGGICFGLVAMPLLKIVDLVSKLRSKHS